MCGGAGGRGEKSKSQLPLCAVAFSFIIVWAEDNILFQTPRLPPTLSLQSLSFSL